MTLYEIYWGTKPKIACFHPFGCEVFALIPEIKQKKFHPKADCGIFLGFAENHEAYHIWSIQDKKVKITIEVKFNDNVFPACANVAPEQFVGEFNIFNMNPTTPEFQPIITTLQNDDPPIGNADPIAGENSTTEPEATLPLILDQDNDSDDDKVVVNAHLLGHGMREKTPNFREEFLYAIGFGDSDPTIKP